MMTLQDATQILSAEIAQHKFLLGIFGIIINLFHLIVLTRKSMSSNSVNVIMIGIAFCDILNLAFFVYEKIMLVRAESLDCNSITLYQVEISGVLIYTTREILRRLSSWLDVELALLRLLVIKNSLNPKFDMVSKSSCGLLFIFMTFLISFTISMLYWMQVDFQEVTPWVPKNNCNSSTVPEIAYTVKPTSTKPYIAIQVLYVIDGTFRIVPSAILPILTYLLVKELKNAKLARRRLSFTKTKIENTDSDHTTKMVIFMTVCSMIAQVPLGIVYVAQGIETSADFQKIAMDLISIFGIFVALNASSHCFICLSVSSQYRTSARSVFRGYQGKK